MYINFHYFTVKTLCLKAGFNEKDAQYIAAYSQFVDDYSIWENCGFRVVPDFAKSLAGDVMDPDGYYPFYTVTTGFESNLDSARLSAEKYQTEIVVPFHFIPEKPLDQYGPEKEYRTKEADTADNSLIAAMLGDVLGRYKVNKSKCELIEIGLLLHIFADTCAHQMFSGMHSWQNFSHLSAVNETVPGGKDITKKFSPERYSKIYAVGHANVNCAPDMAYARWSMTYAQRKDEKKAEDYTGYYVRNNTEAFMGMAKKIFIYLKSLLQENPSVSSEEWNALVPKLQRGFACDSSKVKDLVKSWEEIFPEYKNFYYYNKDALWKDQLKNGFWGAYETADDDFFWYNVIAKKVRDKVLGF